MMEEKKDILKINVDNLIEEFQQQPILYMEAAEELAESNRDRDEVKAEIDLVMASLDKEARSNPAVEKELGKLTETSIKNWVILQPSYRKILEEYHQKKEVAEKDAAFVEALQQRKKALEKIADLWMASYFSTPNEKKGDGLKEGERERTSQSRRQNLKKSYKGE